MLIAPADSPQSVIVVGIATERGDVRAHPVDRGNLVEEPPVRDGIAEMQEALRLRRGS